LVGESKPLSFPSTTKYLLDAKYLAVYEFDYEGSGRLCLSKRSEDGTHTCNNITVSAEIGNGDIYLNIIDAVLSISKNGRWIHPDERSDADSYEEG